MRYRLERCQGVASRVPQSGDVLTFYGTGFGPVTPDVQAGIVTPGPTSLVALTGFAFGNAPATVLFQGLVPGSVGLYQFNVQVPSIASSDSIPIALTGNGSTNQKELFLPVDNSALPTITKLGLAYPITFGGGNVPASVTLSAPAPKGGTNILLTTDDP